MPKKRPLEACHFVIAAMRDEVREQHMMAITFIPNSNQNTPSRFPLMLVSGSRESLSSRTTSVRVSSAGNCRVNLVICPGYHDGGTGSAGNGMLVRTACIIREKRVNDQMECCSLVVPRRLSQHPTRSTAGTNELLTPLEGLRGL